MKRVFRNALLAAVAVTVYCSCQDGEKIKFEQYVIEGRQLYKTNCANCHQEDGRGLEGLYPPLRPVRLEKADFLCISKNGLSGEITVGGKAFNRTMPANPKLTPVEIAEITTFVYAEWGKDTTYVRIKEVERALERCRKN